MQINKIHKIDGVNFVKPYDIFAKLFEVTPKNTAIPRKKYDEARLI